MEITTVIAWNSLVYLLYYGANFGFDYLRIKKKHPGQTSGYSYNELLGETPAKVALPEEKAAAGSAIATEIKKVTERNSPVSISGPVEGQGIPFDMFMQHAKKYSSGIDF